MLRLLTAHLLTDFILQPTSWVKDRKERKIRSVKLLWHVGVTTVIAYLFSGLYRCWWLPLVIFLSHYMIDVIKSYLPDNLYYFLADQFLHIGVIVIIWLVINHQWPLIPVTLHEIVANTHFWIITLGYVLVTWPLGVFIGIATSTWRDDLPSKEGLANAGKWIGICERRSFSPLC